MGGTTVVVQLSSIRHPFVIHSLIRDGVGESPSILSKSNDVCGEMDSNRARRGPSLEASLFPLITWLAACQGDLSSSGGQLLSQLVANPRIGSRDNGSLVLDERGSVLESRLVGVENKSGC